jgi:hypothetical protein
LGSGWNAGPAPRRGEDIDASAQPCLASAARIVVPSAAALLGARNPVLALLPFTETGPGEDSDCGRLIAEARSHGAHRKPTSRQRGAIA